MISDWEGSEGNDDSEEEGFDWEGSEGNSDSEEDGFDVEESEGNGVSEEEGSSATSLKSLLGDWLSEEE